MNTALTDVIPAPVRKYLYAAYVLAGLVVGALNVAGVDTGAAVDVLAYLAIPFGALAVSNTSNDQQSLHGPDVEDDPLWYDGGVGDSA